jgi:hypothetical protein
MKIVDDFSDIYMVCWKFSFEFSDDIEHESITFRKFVGSIDEDIDFEEFWIERHTL